MKTMNIRSLIRRTALLAAMILGPLLQTSCNRLREDMQECKLFIRFKYDYNMTSVDAFHVKVKEVDLYVFDEQGKFLFVRSEQGAPLATGRYRMELDVPAGRYKLLAWAKTGSDDSYTIPGLTPGVSDISEVSLRLERDASLIVDREIDKLWYGEILDVEYKADHNQTEVINLIKDTNKISFVFIGNNGARIAMDDYDYEIIYENAYLDHENKLLPDEMISYQPYFKQQRNESSVKVELNTMRLIDGDNARFVVTRKSDPLRPVLDINLIDYLIMTEIEEHKAEWEDQEYLDRQDEYAIVFIFSETGGSWLAVQITVNGYTCYIQEEEIENLPKR